MQNLAELELSRIAAIDVGSNAIRLLINNVIHIGGRVYFKKVMLTRVPIRLGKDVFSSGKISDHNTTQLIKAMKAYSHLMDAAEVKDYRACATSAMREAENGKDIKKRIQKEAGIDLDIIDGKEEAALIFATEADQLAELDMPAMYTDVGGGSTELTLFNNTDVLKSKSLNLGTVRMLASAVDESEWKKAKKWVKSIAKEHEIKFLIGTGGNINKLIRLVSDGRRGRGLVYRDELKKAYRMLGELSYEERIVELNLNPDRADVIMPASTIFLNIMKWSGAEAVYVPQAGLSDGIIHDLYYKHFGKKHGHPNMMFAL